MTVKTNDDKLIVEAFVNFKEYLDTLIAEQDELIVSLGFESSITSKEHYDFTQDEPVMYKDIMADRGLKGLVLLVACGAEDKLIALRDCDLIEGYSYASGKKVVTNLDAMVTEAFEATFVDIKSASTLADLDHAIKTKPAILTALADPDKAMSGFATRDAYARIQSFGRY